MKFLYPILFAAAFTASAFEFTGKVVGVTDALQYDLDNSGFLANVGLDNY